MIQSHQYISLNAILKTSCPVARTHEQVCKERKVTSFANKHIKTSEIKTYDNNVLSINT